MPGGHREQPEEPTRLRVTNRRCRRRSLPSCWHRFYHAQLGRFMTRDPIGYEGSEWNLYEYAGSRPLFWADAMGLRGDATPNSLPKDEQDELKDCRLRAGGEQPNDGSGWVECDKGHFRIMTLPKKSVKGKVMKECRGKCGLLACTRVHEAYHVLQFQVIRPTCCEGLPDGAVIQVSSNCTSRLECRAHVAGIRCLQKKLKRFEKHPVKCRFLDKKRKRRGTVDCARMVRDRIAKLRLQAEKRYKCSSLSAHLILIIAEFPHGRTA